MAMLVVCAVCATSTFFLFVNLGAASDSSEVPAGTYLGFDLNTYPGDAALLVLRKTFSFGGYWLSAPPGAKENTWTGKREKMLSHKFGFLILVTGPQSAELKAAAQATTRGAADAANTVSAARKDGFPPAAIVFLDIEEGGRLPEK